MPTKVIRKAKIGNDDLSIYDGTATFSRGTSSGSTQNISKFPVGAIPVIATASLPAAAAALNGTIIIEDGGTGDRNIIVYAGGQRFRIDGGAAF